MSTKKFSPIGPAVWPAIGKIYIYEFPVLLYREDMNKEQEQYVQVLSEQKRIK